MKKVCEMCGVVFNGFKSKQRFCTRNCVHVYFRTFKIFSGENNPAFGKTYRSKETHPEWAEKIVKTTQERKINSGDKNGMKDPEVAARMAKTRRERVTSNPDYRRMMSEKVRKAWQDGRYENANTGKCKWYDHTKPDGTVVKLQGTWEVIYARYLDTQNINYITHKGFINYTDSDNNSHSYYPDFYLVDRDTYVDVKGALFYEDCVKKFDAIRSSNPSMKFELMTKEKFKEELKIDIGKESYSFRIENDAVTKKE